MMRRGTGAITLAVAFVAHAAVAQVPWPVSVDQGPASGRGIPAGCVAPPSHVPDMLGRRALPSGRRAPESNPCSTDTGHVLRLTLDDAIARGLETSHRLAEAVARGEAAGAAADQRHAALLPQIAAQAGYTRTNHVDTFGVLLPNNVLRVIYPDIPDNYRSRLDLQWPVYTAGRLDALERAARIEATASSDDVAAARGDLVLEIARAYWTLVSASASVSVVEESVRRVGAHLQDVRNQLASGLLAPNDVLSVEAQESRQRLLAIQARGDREIAESDLARLIGVAPGTAVEPVAVLEPPPPEPRAAANALVEAAKRQRPERAGLVKHAAAATERGRAAAAALKPTIAVGGGFDYARPNPRIFPREERWRTSWDASVNANWPLFDGGRARSEVAEAAALTRAVQERLAELDAALSVEVRQRLTELESGRAAIDAATDAVRSATEARRVVGERFRAGVATSTDVLDAQVAVLQAELDRTQAIAGARLARARLDRALGK
jgi:outer membrane protein